MGEDLKPAETFGFGYGLGWGGGYRGYNGYGGKDVEYVITIKL